MCTYVIILVHRPLMTVLVGGNGKSTRRNHQKWRARCIGGIYIYHDHSTLNGEWANMLPCGHHEGFYNFGWITKHSCVCMTSVEFLFWWEDSQFWRILLCIYDEMTDSKRLAAAILLTWWCAWNVSPPCLLLLLCHPLSLLDFCSCCLICRDTDSLQVNIE